MTKKSGLNTEEQTKQLEDKLIDLEAQLKRAVADYRNLEKRIHDDSSQIVDYSKGQLIKKLLPVLDNLDKAVEGASRSEAESSWLKGVMISIKSLRQVLLEEGLTEIDISDNFNPEFHEAIDICEGEDGKILEVAQRGYTLNSKVLRPAKVVVGKSSCAKATEDEGEKNE